VSKNLPALEVFCSHTTMREIVTSTGAFQMSPTETTSQLPSPVLSQRWEWASKQAISFLMQQAVENADCVALAAGLVDQQTLPVEPTRLALERMLADTATAQRTLQYGTTPGSVPAREAMLRHLARLEKTPVEDLGITADEIVLTTGSQQLLCLLAEVLFDPGDICFVAAPTYFVFLGVLEGVGANIIPVETDENGMVPEALEAALARVEAAGDLHRVKMIYLVSYYENPSGISLSEERRGRMVELAREWSKDHKIYILEDAAYRELRYSGPDIPSVWSFDPTHESVILTQTFSKSFSPGIRVGMGVLPADLVKPVCDRKGNEDFGSSNFNQQLLTTVLNEGGYEEHVQYLQDSYRVKRDAMLAAADEYCSNLPGVTWVHPDGGLYVWMSVPESMPTGFDSPLFHSATREHGVMYVPGELCHVNNARTNEMRLSFGVESPERIALGMQRLAAAIRSQIEKDA